MRPACTLALALSAASWLGVPSPAAAQPDPHAGAEAEQTQSANETEDEPSPERERALPHFHRGLELVEAQQWSEALDSFLRAHAIYPSPIIVFNIGYCQRALGQYVDALSTFQDFLGRELSGAAAARRTAAEHFVRELEARIVHLTVRVPDEHRDAELLVDGRAYEPEGGELHLRLDPGHHTVHVRKEGYRPLFVDRDLAPGSRETVEARLVPLPARLVVSSNVPAAAVLLDGERIGQVPFDAEVEAGRYRLEVRADGHIPHRSRLNLSAGDVARVRAELEPETPSIATRWWFWTALGAAAAAIAGTTYLLVRPEPDPQPYDGGSLDWVVGAGTE